MPSGEVRRYGGSASAALQPSNLVATLDSTYYADPRKLWYAPYAAFAPLNLTITGNQLTVKSTSSTWTGSAVVAVAPADGTITGDHTVTANVATGAAAAPAPRIGALPHPPASPA